MDREARLDAIRNDLKDHSDKEHAARLQGYFKTGKGEYAEGDIFLGLRVPQIRSLVKKYRGISLEQVSSLIRSPFHEERLFSLLALVELFKHSDAVTKKGIYEFYIANTRFINNWDLVDLSAGKIVGAYLLNRDKAPLYLLAKSESLWERRISIISTSRFIAHSEFSDTLKIAGLLLKDKEDLIHKAVGWMLREVGKRDLKLEMDFLNKHYSNMPRTMLRYAIERFPAETRESYLKGTVAPA